MMDMCPFASRAKQTPTLKFARTLRTLPTRKFGPAHRSTASVDSDQEVGTLSSFQAVHHWGPCGGWLWG